MWTRLFENKTNMFSVVFTFCSHFYQILLFLTVIHLKKGVESLIKHHLIWLSRIPACDYSTFFLPNHSNHCICLILILYVILQQLEWIWIHTHVAIQCSWVQLQLTLCIFFVKLPTSREIWFTFTFTITFIDNLVVDFNMIWLLEEKLEAILLVVSRVSTEYTSVLNAGETHSRA